MRKNIVRAEPRPVPASGTAAPETRATAPAPEEVRGLTQDELRRLVLDIIG